LWVRVIRAECKLAAAVMGHGRVDELGRDSRLTRDRPAIVSGVYLSMSGFTEEAKKEALEQARDRSVVLLDAEEIRSLFDGQHHIADIFDERVDQIIRRY
jgi:hypothetical protein